MLSIIITVLTFRLSPPVVVVVVTGDIWVPIIRNGFAAVCAGFFDRHEVENRHTSTNQQLVISKLSTLSHFWIRELDFGFSLLFTFSNTLSRAHCVLPCVERETECVWTLVYGRRFT